MSDKTKSDKRVTGKPSMNARASADQGPSEPLVIGKIGQPFGVRGWVRVMSFCSPQDNILDHDVWWLRQPKSGFAAGRSEEALQRLSVTQIKPHGKGFVAVLAGMADRDEALALRGWEIVIDRAELPNLPEDDFYWYQLEGLTVKAVSGQILGTLTQMLETGANDVMVVKPSDASIDDKKRLIPYRFDAVVKSVDLESKSVVVDWDLDF